MGGAARVADALARVFGALGWLVLAFMVITICYDAIMRYAFTAPTSWSLEINTFLIVYLAVMTAADTQRVDAHIRISFLAARAGRATRRALRVATGLVGALFCGVMAWRGALLALQAWEYGERVSSSFGTPMVLPYGMLPLGFAALGLQFLLGTVRADEAADAVDIR